MKHKAEDQAQIIDDKILLILKEGPSQIIFG
jgi:hypothetical protein